MEYLDLIFDSRTDRITAIFKCKHRVPRASSFIYKTLEEKKLNTVSSSFFLAQGFRVEKEEEEQETEMEKTVMQ